MVRGGAITRIGRKVPWFKGAIESNTDLKAKLAAVEAARVAADKLVKDIADLSKKLEGENGELTKLREVRAGKKDGTPEFKAFEHSASVEAAKPTRRPKPSADDLFG